MTCMKEWNIGQSGMYTINKDYFWNKKIIVSYILSILVFWIHCSSFIKYDYNNVFVSFFGLFFSRTINLIAVPLFFILSGVTFYRDYTDKKYVHKLRGRVKSLIIPFAVWNILNMFFQMIASAFFSEYFTGREKMVLSVKNILLGIFHYKYNEPFWFLFALIVFTVAAPVIDKLLHSKLTAILSIIMLLILYYFDIGLPQPLFYSKTCIIFYLVGGFIGRFCFEKISTPADTRYQVISAVSIVGALVFYTLINYGVIEVNPVIDVIILIVLSICFWHMFDICMPKSLVNIPDVFKHSFWVFALHVNISAVISKLLYMILPKIFYFSLINFALTTILTLISIEIICYYIKKIVPSIYALLAGERI